MLLLLSASVLSDVKKFVDESGVTHKGEKTVASKEERPKELTGFAKEMADSYVDTMRKGSGDAPQVNCIKAVFNAKDGIDTMLLVGEKNFKAGYLSRAEFDNINKDLSKVEKRISLKDCRSAAGNKLGFYKCMSNDHNHVAHCGEKYSF